MQFSLIAKNFFWEEREGGGRVGEGGEERGNFLIRCNLVGNENDESG